MLVVIFHLVEIGYKAFVLRTPFTMLPGFQDVKDAWMALRYNLGLGKSRPQMGRYSFEEKAEYWALVWGILIMALTGFAMWNPLATVQTAARAISFRPRRRRTAPRPSWRCWPSSCGTCTACT